MRREREERRGDIRHGIDIERASTTCLAVQWGVAKLCLFHAVALCDALSSRYLRHRHLVSGAPVQNRTPANTTCVPNPWTTDSRRTIEPPKTPRAQPSLRPDRLRARSLTGSAPC